MDEKTKKKLRKLFDKQFSLQDDMDWERDLQTEVFEFFIKNLTGQKSN